MKYKARDCFEMRKIADDYIVIPRGPEMLNYNATIVFNESGVFLWKLLKNYIELDELAKQLANKYSLEFDEARKDTENFINKMLDERIIETQE